MTAKIPTTPFFSIITVAYKDAWAMTKTSRSVFRQTFDDFEYLIVDGASKDGTEALIEFWRHAELVDGSICEPDQGVYEAMNKGIELAKGDFICFLNAGDVFAHDDVLARAHRLLSSQDIDGCLGWGELNGQVWASWCESEAFKLSSLGFCHQSLFVKRSLLLKNKFDERPKKTDSDTLQLSRFYRAGATIPIVPEVWAIRGGEPGISANLERTKRSIIVTLTEEYPSLSESEAEMILAFRRQCEEPDRLLACMIRAPSPLREHIACMVLDTLFQRQSRNLSDDSLRALEHEAASILRTDWGKKGHSAIDQLIVAQQQRADFLRHRFDQKESLRKEVEVFRGQEASRFTQPKFQSLSNGCERPTDFAVSLTSFPARISTLPYVIRSLVEQTCPPKSIHLQLGRDEIPNRNWLSKELLAFEDRGLMINFVDRTFHQYDKYLHNSGVNEDVPFIMVDDDVIYHEYSIEHLIKAHHLHPNTVIANRCHQMSFNRDGGPVPYREWQREAQSETPSFLLMPTGAGGVLYPPGFMTPDFVTDISDILAHAPYADDIWLKFCALAQNIATFATGLSSGSEWYHRYTPTMRAGTLMATNVDLGLNDIQIQRCVDWLEHRNPNWREAVLHSEIEYAS